MHVTNLLTPLLLLSLAACSDPVDPGDLGPLQVTPERDTLAAGAELQLLAFIVSAEGDTATAGGVLWSSSDPDIASITSSGRVTGHRSGEVTIAAVAPAGRAVATISVERRFRATAVAVASDHLCALDLDGMAWCFGQDWGGNLGLGTFYNSTATMTAPVLGGHVFRAITVNLNTACGLALDGRVWCWGRDWSRLDANPQTTVPVIVDPGRVYDMISGGGSNTCGVSAEEVFCWGESYRRPRTPFSDPVPRLISASVSAFEDCGITIAGNAVCWSAIGYTLAEGPPSPQFGTVSTSHNWDPQDRGPYVCGVVANGTAYCWGTNSHGQLGDGTTTSRATPGPVSGAQRFSAVATNPTFACGLELSGVAFCWGANDHGQLGRGDSTAGATPQPVGTALRFLSLSANPGTGDGGGRSRACGVSTDQELLCWGEGAGPTPSPIRY